MTTSNTLKPGLAYSQDVVIYKANILTVNEAQPTADVVAVKDGKILAVGSQQQVESEIEELGLDFTINSDFCENTLVPGFVEAHMHPTVVALFTARFGYVGQIERKGAEGKTLFASLTKEELQATIKGHVTAHNDAGKKGEWLNLWGLDPLLIQGDILVGKDFLDEICSDSPIMIMHTSCHVSSFNSLAIEKTGFTIEDNPEFVRQEGGQLTGEVCEIPDMSRAQIAGAMNFGTPEDSLAAMLSYGDTTSRLGLTTMSDCGMGVPANPYPLYQAISQMPHFKSRIAAYPLIPFFSGEQIKEMEEVSNDRLFINKVKYLGTDGSIPGFTARLKEGDTYYNGNANGPFINSLEKMYDDMFAAHKLGYSVSLHCNGEGMTIAALDMFEKMQKECPQPNVRHCLEHNQMVTPELMDRMNELGVVHNLFGTHITFWGDIHASTTVGPERAKTLNPFQTSVKKDVPFAIHCDDAVTQVNPIFMMWSAMNRQCIYSGTVYGEDECLTAEQALHALTLGPAYLMEQENMIGSIEVGKLADFAILDKNPLTTDKADIKDIKVSATVLGGQVFDYRH
ncbi:amidohydrolase [Vibrio lamellibrachiae]|uniref:amidohydrolase n=1 Tax=Vibrio lamellibrachiae TaxID=2910253 RepID=UPI003D10221C